MDFLSRHYEKLILGFCLICFMWSMFSVQKKVSESAEALKQVKRTATTLATGTKILRDYNIDNFMKISDWSDSADLSLRLDVNILNLEAEAGRKLEIRPTEYISQEDAEWRSCTLMSPARFIICCNPGCYTILPFNGHDTLICHVCGTEQYATGPEPTEADDLDEDGIPDFIEKKYPFLDYRFRYDTYDDADGDGFTNGEEYAAGTDMEDAKNYPGLGYLVRIVGRPFNQTLPFKFNRIRKPNNTEDANEWLAVFDQGAEAKVGEELKLKNYPGYILLSINGADNSVEVQTPRGEIIVMKKGKPAIENGQSVKLRFLKTRFGQPVIKVDRNSKSKDMVNARKRPEQVQRQIRVQDDIIVVRPGEEFTLKADRSGLSTKNDYTNYSEGNENMASAMPAVYEEENTEISEVYRLVSVENLKVEGGQSSIRVYIEKVTDSNGVKEKNIEVKEFNPRFDVTNSRQNQVR